MKSSKTFFIVGYYGAGNLGDELILEIIINKLKKQTEAENICVTSYDFEYTKKRHGNIKTIHPSDLYGASEVIKKSSLMIFGAGGIFSDDKKIFEDFDTAAIFDDPAGGINLYYAYSVIARLNNVKYITVSTSISTINNKENNKLLSQIFNQSEMVFMRDSLSISRANKLTVDNSKVQLVADPVFSLYDPKILKNNSEKTALVSLRDWISESDDLLYSASKLVSCLEQKGYKVIFIPFQERDFPYENDLVAIKKVISNSNLKNYEVKDSNLTFEEIRNCYNRSSVIVGMRLHSLILALISRKPFIALSYDSKIKGLMNDIGASDFCIEGKIDDPKDIIDKCIGILSKKEYPYQDYLNNAHKKGNIPFAWIDKQKLNVTDNGYKELVSSKKTNKQKLEEVYEGVVYFKQQLAQTEQSLTESNDKLQSLYGTRIIIYALKLVDLSIWLRKFTPRLKRKIRVTISKITPTIIKRAYKKIKLLALNKKRVYVKNTKFPEDQPLISIVSPFYNSSQTVKDTIDSVLSQTYQNFEYIIVDDGSKKEETEELKKIISHADRSINLIVFEENKGKGSPAYARNFGISKAKGKYILCIDSDDFIEPTYIEKALLVLETQPWISHVSSGMKMFGVKEDIFKYGVYDPLRLIEDNFVTTACIFRKELHKKLGGYKTEIGYEDWELWINFAEKGMFGFVIDEALLNYRTASSSRYIEDKKRHTDNIRKINSLHPNYKKIVKKFVKKRDHTDFIPDYVNGFLNISKKLNYRQADNTNKNVLICMSWMTFGGAETLVNNLCREVYKDFNISFVTGIKSANEWEYKFREITPNIYHMPNLFGEDGRLYQDFIVNYIQTRNINTLHIIHTSFVFDMLPEIRKRFPEIKIIVTVFNDRAHFNESLEQASLVDIYTSDNNAVYNKYSDKLKELGSRSEVKVIPNGINNSEIFNPDIYDRQNERQLLDISNEQVAVFFIGRLSEEKKPDAFLEVAQKVLSGPKKDNFKFFVIGDGPMRDEVEDKIKSIKSSNIQYLGYQSEVARFLSPADIFVLPSSIEGFPLSIIEAMAMECVVVASDVGAVADVLENKKDGFVVKPSSVDEITDVLMTLEKERELIDEMKKLSSIKVAEKYSNKILGKNYKDLYDGKN